MTLAAILFICVFCSAPDPVSAVVRLQAQSSEQQPPPAKPPDSSPEKDQSKAGSTQNPATSEVPTPPPTAATPVTEPPSSAPAQTHSDKNAAARKPSRHKRTTKNAKALDCEKTSLSSTASPSDPAVAGDASATMGSNPPVKCPPAKTVVHDGGTSEPAIQLVGGAGGQQAAGQRLTTDQLVGSTEENLKKTAGRQLNSNQQEMLKQIRQFLDQSKAAVAVGDVERGHNLAMKAHLLSDELTKP